MMASIAMDIADEFQLLLRQAQAVQEIIFLAEVEDTLRGVNLGVSYIVLAS